jgi:hypothetical protein
MKAVCRLISVLSILLMSVVCRAEIAGSNTDYCFSLAQNEIANFSCPKAERGTSGYEALRARLWGEVVRQVWRSSRKRHERSQLQMVEESEGVKKEGGWKRFIRDGEYDLSVSSDSLLMSMRVRF